MILVSAAAARADGDTRSALNLFAGTHFTRVVARLGAGGVEPADAPVKSSGDRDVEGLGKRPFPQFVVAANVAAHFIVGLTIHLRLEDALRRDGTRQQFDRAVRIRGRSQRMNFRLRR